MKNLKINFFILVLLLNLFTTSKAITPPDEGMWLPIWIEKMNYENMKTIGFNLSAEKIYDTKNPSMKDAVVGLGKKGYGVNMFFCTGEIVSDKGLILTNHHCAHSAIQSLSSIENDYLTDGFWAYNEQEELPIEDMTISILQRMEDVTKQVLSEVTPSMTEEEREFAIKKEISKIEESASQDGKYNVYVRGFFEGNEYYLYVYETYKDIRLVGAPPSSIGKFGGDTDNWMWPRHTGDFSYLRVYMASDGTPAEYSKNNIPFKPKHYFPISIKGIKKGDFSMTFGFPGSTDRYLTSYGIDNQLKYKNPNIIEIRDLKLDIMKSFMDKDPKTRIQYASKHAQTANYWKYYIGQTKGLNLHNVYDDRKELEDKFINWVNQDDKRKEKYGNVLSDIKECYDNLAKTSKLMTYIEEAIFQGPEFIYYSFSGLQLLNALAQQQKASKSEKEELNKTIQSLTETILMETDNHFKDYNINVDKKLFSSLMELMYNNIEKEFISIIFSEVEKKHKGNFNAWADEIYSKSIFVDKDKMVSFLNNPKLQKIKKDPGFKFTINIINVIRSLYNEEDKINEKMARAKRLFIEGLRVMSPDKLFYPDANSTIRMSYGKVLDYFPADAAHYDFTTTMKGIFEKENPSKDEFIVPLKLKELYNNKDFGQYAENDMMTVCLLTDNDITGGNSGSPLINADGQLIGIAFDGNWESMSGDIQYEPSVQRTISVDIRYVLFITEKYAGAKNLINEMKIIK